jgi:hypothetical protein
MVLGRDHPALGGHMPVGHTARTVASTSRHPVLAVPRGRRRRADDRGQIGGEHTSSQLPRSGAASARQRVPGHQRPYRLLAMALPADQARDAPGPPRQHSSLSRR